MTRAPCPEPASGPGYQVWVIEKMVLAAKCGARAGVFEALPKKQVSSKKKNCKMKILSTGVCTHTHLRYFFVSVLQNEMPVLAGFLQIGTFCYADRYKLV